MDIDTVNKAIIAAVPALILAIGAGFTAFFITRKIEEMKLRAQADLERERMAFQKESELQKQRMELYKTLYLERVKAVSKLTEQTASVYAKIIEGWNNPSYNQSNLRLTFDEAAAYSNAVNWLLSEPLKSSADAFFLQVIKYLNTASFETRNGLINQIGAYHDAMGKDISAMMLNSDLSSILVFPASSMASESS